MVWSYPWVASTSLYSKASKMDMQQRYVLCQMFCFFFFWFLLWEEMGALSSWAKTKRTTWTVISNKSKSQVLWWFVSVSLTLFFFFYTSTMAALMQESTQSNVSYYQDNIGPGHVHAFLSANYKTTHIIKAWLRKKRICVQDWSDWLETGPNLYPTEDVWHILKPKQKNTCQSCLHLVSIHQLCLFIPI